MYNIPSMSNRVDAAPTSLGAIIVNILSVMRPPLGANGKCINLFQLKFDYRRTPRPFIKGKRMTQRIFDIENEKDMADLWDIVPEEIEVIEKSTQNSAIYRTILGINSGYQYIKINWHDKTEITRPIQEATEADVGKICYFGDVKPDKKIVGFLGCIDSESTYNKYMMRGGTWFTHCRRLTKQEIEELC